MPWFQSLQFSMYIGRYSVQVVSLSLGTLHGWQAACFPGVQVLAWLSGNSSEEAIALVNTSHFSNNRLDRPFSLASWPGPL